MTTIFALATPRGRSGVALVRLSGAGAPATLEALSRKKLPEPRRATRRILWPEENEAPPIDEVVAVYYPAPHSYTGEDVIELGLHGGPAVIAAALNALSRRPDHRLAEPGEFTKIAFHNGKLDLVEIEGLADLIAADTEAQRVQALRQADGEASSMYGAWRAQLLALLARHEATIDFSEEDIPLKLVRDVTDGMAALATRIERFLDDGGRGERLREGASIAILGAANVGKSSLLNRLAGRPAAIVTPIAGTTRDVIEVRLDLEGMPAILADTAGLRESQDLVENEGIRRAIERADAADVTLLIFDGERWPDLDVATIGRIDERAILVLNKADLCTAPGPIEIAGRKAIVVSALSGQGIDDLARAMAERCRSLMPTGEGPVVTRARQRTHLSEAAQALRRGLAIEAPELRGEELRLASRALGRLVGQIDVEEVLGGIFREFCIGK